METICTPYYQERILIEEADAEENKALQSQKDASIEILTQVEAECAAATNSEYHAKRCPQKVFKGLQKIDNAKTSSEINEGLEFGKTETCG
jgi:hypothetical protein